MESVESDVGYFEVVYLMGTRGAIGENYVTRNCKQHKAAGSM